MSVSKVWRPTSVCIDPQAWERLPKWLKHAIRAECCEEDYRHPEFVRFVFKADRRSAVDTICKVLRQFAAAHHVCEMTAQDVEQAESEYIKWS